MASTRVGLAGSGDAAGPSPAGEAAADASAVLAASLARPGAM